METNAASDGSLKKMVIFAIHAANTTIGIKKSLAAPPLRFEYYAVLSNRV